MERGSPSGVGVLDREVRSLEGGKKRGRRRERPVLHRTEVRAGHLFRLQSETDSCSVQDKLFSKVFGRRIPPQPLEGRETVYLRL